MVIFVSTTWNTINQKNDYLGLLAWREKIAHFAKGHKLEMTNLEFKIIIYFTKSWIYQKILFNLLNWSKLFVFYAKDT